MSTEFNGKRIFDFIKKINFIRLGGTENEKKAANIIKNEFESFGIAAYFHEFPIATSNNSIAELKFIDPYKKNIKITHRVISGHTSTEGITRRFKYIDSAGERYCDDIEDKIVLMTGNLDRIVYERLVRHKVAAVLVPMNIHQELLTVGFDIDFVKKFGELPICYISYHDALEMVKNNISKIWLKIEDGVDFDATGINVVAEIKGSLRSDEEFYFIGHYDSVLNNGIYDNAAGTAYVLELARHFNKFPPKRTIKFVLFSGEELGLRGSKAYIAYLKKNANNLKHIKMVFNFDLGGTILGRNCVRITGPIEIFNFIDALNKIEDWDFLVENDIYSSDNMPFGLEGVPSINFFRSALGIGHAPNDTIDHISPESFNLIGEFAIKLTSGIINAPILPFKRRIGVKMAKKIKQYFENCSPDEPDEEDEEL